MADKQFFETELIADYNNSSATAIKFPFDVETVFGAKRVPVCGTINGAAFRSTIFRMHSEQFMVVNRQLREAANAEAGDKVRVEIERDVAPRTIEPPADLLAALNENPAAKEIWERISYTHKKEFAAAIEEPKKPETRARRMQKTIAELLNKYNKKQ
ncbi:MAG TPA: YdeI/OmpD-associated family protein [Pyrinomonadaceae bacterium]|nr:YdeI/OmpD-associated family protein [Pyrinomonadaceae bacterium]